MPAEQVSGRVWTRTEAPRTHVAPVTGGRPGGTRAPSQPYKPGLAKSPRSRTSALDRGSQREGESLQNPVQRLRRATSAFGIPVAIALVIRATLVQAYHIPSGSMENTLFPGDFVLAEKLTFGPTVP